MAFKTTRSGCLTANDLAISRACSTSRHIAPKLPRSGQTHSPLTYTAKVNIGKIRGLAIKIKMPGINKAQRRLETLHWIGLELARQRATWDYMFEKRAELGDTIGARYAKSILSGIHTQIYENSTEQNALRDCGVELSWRVSP